MRLSSRPTLAELLRGHRRLVWMLAACSLLGGIAEAVFLVTLTRAAFAITAGKQDVGVLAGHRLPVATTLLLALALVLLRIAMSAAANWYAARLNSDVTRQLRRRLSSAFLRSTWAAQQGSATGRLQELVSSYSNAGASMLASYGAGIVAAFTLFSLLGLAAAVDPIGSLVAIGALAVLGAALRPLRARVQTHSRLANRDGMALAMATGEVAGLGIEVHIFDVRDQVEARIGGLLDAGAVSARRLNIVRGLVPSIYTGLAYLALVGAIGLASIWDEASLTSLGAVMLVMLRSLSYGQQLQTSYSAVQSALPQVRDVLDEASAFEAQAFVDAGDPVTQVCPLRLDRVSFHYVEGQPVLHDVTAEIRQHELVGIVGPSGSGKSTLVQLLLGLRTPVVGTVLADGRDIRSLAHSSWAQRVTFVPQEPVLISGTIADNVRFFRSGISDDAIERAARKAGLHDEISAFPLGYDHQVGDRGSNLSGGQQQRLCIARALVAEPQLLILDEPTSALDAKSETLVRETLAALRPQMSIVVIAHRLSTLDDCDRIMIIQHGGIAAFDTPANLRQSANFYAEAIRLSGLSGAS